MRVVVDTNILFSFFWRNSFIRKVLVSSNNEFVSSGLAIKELKKYSSLIINKTGISEKEFSIELNKLKNFVKFFSKKEYIHLINEAKRISPDKNDSEFLALCLKLSFPLWSNDKLLKKQDKVIVLNTEDFIDLMF
ncbi:MAG: PIN domain-containing protein [Nanoarchaeota archaeon]